jgi:hypothetical protein
MKLFPREMTADWEQGFTVGLCFGVGLSVGWFICAAICSYFLGF